MHEDHIFPLQNISDIIGEEGKKRRKMRAGSHLALTPGGNNFVPQTSGYFTFSHNSASPTAKSHAKTGKLQPDLSQDDESSCCTVDF